MPLQTGKPFVLTPSITRLGKSGPSSARNLRRATGTRTTAVRKLNLVTGATPMFFGQEGHHYLVITTLTARV
jgi:hypothetical protein